MKKGRRNFLQKMTSVLLSAVLIVGMSVGAVPAKVQAEENTEIVESVSENTTELIKEETVTESKTETKTVTESETEPETNTENETEPETVTENETEPATNMEETQPQADKTSVMPVATPAAGNYTANQQVTLTTDTTGAEIYYTTDGTTPDRNNGTKYTGEISVTGEAGISVEKTIKAIAIKDGMVDSETLEAVYTIEIPATPNPDIAASGEDWTLDVTGVLTISSDTGLSNWKAWSNTFDADFNREYSRAGKKMFIKKVVIETGVTNIVNAAFNSCNNLTEVHISDTVKNIGAQAFRSCGLTAVDLPDNLQTMGNLAFAFCKFSTVIIPETVKVIPAECFYKCPLTSITIPAGITEIQTGAFNRCNLTEVKVKGNMPPVIGDNIFANCALEKNDIEVPEGYAATYKMEWPAWASYIKPDTNLNYPVAYGEGWSLNGTGVLTIKSDIGMSNWKAWSNTFDANFNQQYSPAGKKLFIKEVVIETGVTDIVDEAFDSCNNLTEIHIPDTVKNIGNEAFWSCALTAVDIPNNLQTIGVRAFAHCKFTTVVIPETVKVISEECFFKCPLTSITIPAGITEIQTGAFNQCTLTEVKVKGNTPPAIGGDIFYLCSFVTSNTKGIKVPAGCVEAYKNAWSEWKNYIQPYFGKIEVDKEQGENTPDTVFGTSKDALILAVLASEERSLVDAGIDIKIILDIDNIDVSVNPSDKQAVTDKARDYKVGQYLDINLYKIIGADRTKVSQTNGKIRIVLTIPDNLKITDREKTRSYAVVRVHNGVAEILPDTDNDTATITFETDLFSTYALVYKDTANTGSIDKDNNDNDSNTDNRNDSDSDNDNHTVGTGEDNEPKTGETTPVEICATIAMIAGFSYLLDLFGNMKGGMTEQEKKEMVASIIAWGRKGGKLRRLVALALIFVILVYYHSIGRQVDVDWKEAYGE